MPNYSREDVVNQGNTEVGLGVALLGGLAALIGGVVVASNNNSNIRAQIADIDRQINDLQSGLMGSWLNSDEISRLKRKRQELVQKLGGSE